MPDKYIIYTAARGETFDSVALAMYGDESLVPNILQNNPALCGKMVFDGGDEIIVPVISISETKTDSATAPWRKVE